MLYKIHFENTCTMRVFFGVELQYISYVYQTHEVALYKYPVTLLCKQAPAHLRKLTVTVDV